MPNSDVVEMQRWIGPGDWRMAAYVEKGWLEQIETCQLFRYSFDGVPFVSIDDAGMYVCRTAVETIAVEPLGNLAEHLAAANVDLRPVDSLQPLADAKPWESSLHFSGIRLENATDWRVPR